MQTSSAQSEKTDKKKQQHEPGAYAAWGLIVGALGGSGVGLLFGQWLLTGIIGGTLGGAVGAFLDRRRT